MALSPRPGLTHATFGSISTPMPTAAAAGPRGRPRHPSGLPWPEEVPEPERIVRLGGREVYTNPWLTVREDQVRFGHGHEGMYGVVTTSPCVGMLPFVDDDHVVLVRQWRYVTGQATWEMPTGGCLPGERSEDAAQRELAEEVGMAAGTLERLVAFDSSKSVVDERATLFVARDLSPATADELDATEALQAAVFPFSEVVDQVVRGEIVDAMTIIAVLHVALRGNR